MPTPTTIPTIKAPASTVESVGFGVDIPDSDSVVFDAITFIGMVLLITLGRSRNSTFIKILIRNTHYLYTFFNKCVCIKK
ncbi:hypothetical protein DSM106972_075370 [Dulcicalothrix desertica PCC 7102]|uniref:Uncharacterized protein n=1 Tax=Dulcicalothrix desertica PCC 7102 TaxID=232991 RepID=A0A3S1CYM4_9CYAN|nr:hypothetical protein DSM106972_075370 [Dulcicalothrix desertica PCC 7102]